MKKNLIKNLAQKIARTLLKICAITYKKEPYKWASGMLMRIYSDNRMLLNNYQHRWRTAQGFKELLKGKEFDYLLGIPTVGIAPAASLAQLMDKHLLVNMGEYFIDYPNDLWGNKLNKETRWVSAMKAMLTDNNINIIVTYGTEMIPYGVQLANITKLPFAYLRNNLRIMVKANKLKVYYLKVLFLLLFLMEINPQKLKY